LTEDKKRATVERMEYHKIVVATPQPEKAYWSSVQGQMILSNEESTSSTIVDVEVVAESTTGLSKLYNQFIQEAGPEEILTFIHDDVEIHDGFFCKKLKYAHKNYPIVGLAGLVDTPEIKTRCMWHLMGEKKSGFVSHKISPSTYNSSYFGPSPQEVNLIDGLCISVVPEKLKQADVWFDEDFDFHFYDLAFCMRARKAGLKITTWPIFVIHHGLGHPDKNFNELEQKFKKKYYDK
jgi:GT2 family glycosyltransferase